MADFVIVGGGVYGCGVAWELSNWKLKRLTESP
jgi:L-2-hydroxyglutarate oxidase LhgO